MPAGDAANVIPQRAELRLSVRALQPAVRQMLRQRIKSLAELHASGFGARAEVIFDPPRRVLALAADEGVPPAPAADRLAEERMAGR